MRAAQSALSIVKTDNSTTYTPGGTAAYVLTITNAGPSDAASVSVSDVLPAGVTLSAGATCTANGLAACGTLNGATGGNAVTLTGGSIAVGAGNSLVISVPVQFAAGLVASSLTNTASASANGAPPVTATDTAMRAAQASLTLTKSDGRATYTPGATATYVLTLVNAGPSNAPNVAITDNLPAGVTLTASPFCNASGAATCGTVVGSIGGSSMSMTGAALPAGAPHALTLSVPVRFAASLTASPLVNTASASASGAAAVSASDSDTLSAQAALQLTKTDGSGTYTPGATATYLLRIVNGGVSDATSVTVTDNLPAGVTIAATPTCAATGVASCGILAGGIGADTFSASAAMIGAGSGNVLEYRIPVRFASAMTADPLVNTASVSADGGATAVASDTNVRHAPDEMLAIPVDSRIALALLVIAVLFVRARMWRRR
jgi:uncharacterized repeat protein (TIGR01451 family)